MAESLKIMPVQSVGAVSHCMSSPQSYAHDAKGRSYVEPSKKQIATYALSRLEAARALDVENHEKNLPAIENNKLVHKAVAEFMAGIGMPLKWSERDTKSRARYPKTITREAGYLEDLRRHVPTSDGFASASLTYQTLKTRYDEYAREGEREAEEKARAGAEAEERRKAERRANLELAEIILRYGLDRDAEWSDVLDALRKRDQRLDLAVAMQQTRCDWSEGAYRVSSAFGRFTIENDEDKEIANCIASILAEFEDGREFRDCEWSYDRLFSSASDQQLATDIQTAMERSSHG